jgi:hypothetical protein
MRNLAAMALGLLITGLGLYGAAAVTPLAFPAAFDAQGATFSAVALFVMLSITVVFTMFGGWITARLVTDHAPGHAVLMSVVALVPAVMVGAIRWSAAPSLYYVVSWLLMPCAAALGAAAWARTVRRKTRDVAHRRVATT